MNDEERQGLKDLAEQLNTERQDWEIRLRIDPQGEARLADLNFLAGITAATLHTLAYGIPVYDDTN